MATGKRASRPAQAMHTISLVSFRAYQLLTANVPHLCLRLSSRDEVQLLKVSIGMGFIVGAIIGSLVSLIR